MRRKMIVHCKRDHYDVYIGRGGRWGNPFRIGPDRSRREAIAQYNLWLCKEVEAGRIAQVELAELHGKVLGCWCAPEECHGEVLARYARYAHEELYG